MQHISLESGRCTGCRICELTCSVVKEKVYNPRKARIRIRSFGLPELYGAVVCQQCSDAPCIDACPTGALFRNFQEAPVLLESANCIGCQACIEVCEYGAIWLHPQANTAYKCDLCNGSTPCVKECPTGALSVVGGEPASAFEQVKAFLRERGLRPGEFLIGSD